jgi:hypothetical protein
VSKERKVYRIHTHESVYVGPKEPHNHLPPGEVDMGYAGTQTRADWSLTEQANGDVLVVFTCKQDAHVNPDPITGAVAPYGYRYVTRVPSANLKCVQYESEPLTAPVAAVKVA